MTDWEWLAVAQHHGLPTRLLDWSTNPLIAAYFAARDERDLSGKKFGDSVIWAVHLNMSVVATIDPWDSVGPFGDFGEIALFPPRGIVPRIARQGGLFTAHDPPDKALDEIRPGVVTLEKIVIARGYRELLLKELDYYGISSASLFPDLDGLSARLKWAAEAGTL